ncbi:DctP family TRAP transporter solute-binding subunit [Ammoniphilus sp. YIM 78166]|uniref:TRAP transporter substrate-binding protein n=1 Tax=Ammoniphilus sp. YIM 78166 TaxID=1644106 RepID=UPI00106FE3B9|nr:DctP family TRAP transporter solute-binding subunit [Ammoniphilus sp. YIM 78166]
MKKFALPLATILSSALILGACSSDTPQASSSESDGTNKVYEIKLSHSSPATEDRLENSLQEFKKKVEERTNGAIKITTFPASQLGGEREQLEGVQMGSIHMAALAGPLPSVYPEIMVIEMPYLFKNEEIAYEVLDGPVGQEILDGMLEKTGIRALAWGENGFRNFTNNKHPIKKPEDVKGLKIRTMENPAHMAMVVSLGGSPTPMAFGEVYSSLQQGVIDGQENPVSLIESMRFYEVNKYATLDGHVYNPYAFIINESLYQSFPDEYKQIIQEEAKNWSDLQRKMNQEQVAKGIENLKGHGMQVETLTDEEKEAFRTATQPVYDRFRNELGVELMDKVLKAVEEAEAKMAKK